MICTRTPDAHWTTEARYRGQKVIAVYPDYADNVEFVDEWLPARSATVGALAAMATGHAVLKESSTGRPRTSPGYVKKYTDLPHLVRLEPGEDGHYRGPMS